MPIPFKKLVDLKLTSLAPTPIQLQAMLPYLQQYPINDAKCIETDFREGFSLHFEGQSSSYKAKNHKSAHQHPEILRQKVQKEINLCRIIGPYKTPPLPNFRCSAVGLVPKKSNNPEPESTDNWRFIHDLSSAPDANSVNSGVPE